MVDLYWIPGPAGLGGNERVDQLSKSYATNTSVVNTVNFTCSISQKPWCNFPLSNVPLSMFTYNLPMVHQVDGIVD